jgi:hypothetical protein
MYAYEASGGSGAAVYAGGDMIASGSKPAVVRTSQGHRLLYAQESPEVWFEDFGEGAFAGGRAHIDLDELFLETVTIDELHPMKVFVQLTSGVPAPVVVEKGRTGFDLRVADISSGATFDYRVVAKRKGYEEERLRETDAGYDDPNLYPELLAEIEKREEEQISHDELEREQLLRDKQRMEEKNRLMEREREAQEEAMRRAAERQPVTDGSSGSRVSWSTGSEPVGR